MLEVKPTLPVQAPGNPLTPEQVAIGHSLRAYYQLHGVGPTPMRLQMLLDELTRRAKRKPPST